MQERGPAPASGALRRTLPWLLCLAAFGGASRRERATVIDFDAVDARHDRVVATRYLAEHGITLDGVSAGTRVVIVDAATLYGGRALVASSPHNVLTQIDSNDPVSFTLVLPGVTASVRFTRPALLAGPTGVTFPEWRAEALGESGPALDAVGEPLGSGPRYYSSVPARTFTLKGPGIRSLRFSSNNHHFAAFSAVVIDDLTLDPQPARP